MIEVKKAERTRRTRENAFLPNDCLLEFTVRDTGIGISPDQRDRLFQSFSQVDASTRRKYGGTGLGLVISKKLVELMGGEIGAESEPGEGSTFWFTVRLEAQPQDPQAATHPRADLRGLRVLIVDDNATNRTVFHHYLTAWGMQSESVEGGPQGLAALRMAVDHNQPYDLALLDYHMPEMNGLDLARAIIADPALAPLKLVVLSSLGQRGEAKAADYVRIAAWLTKPVRQSQLFDCLATTFSQSSQKERPQPTARVAPPLREETALQHRPLVLVAEDNAVNQKLAVHMLEKLGYRADVVADGHEALEALSRIPYSAVLMDCQMPELDGFEATREIRARENIRGTHLPIIAMTANAMRGDRERCLEAGMDDYLPKPVKPEELKAVLARWTDPAGAAAVSPSPLPSSSPGSIFNLVEALERVGGDRQLLGEMATLFLQSSPKLLTDLQTALVHQDAKALAYAAHTLKGSAGNFSAPGVFNAAASLEKLARTQDLVQAPAVLTTLTHELSRLQSALTHFSTGTTAEI